MSLMIEDMNDGPPERRLHSLSAAHVRERRSEPLWGELGNPARKLVVCQCSLSAKVLEVGVELLVESTNAWTNEPVGNRHALEARESDPVGEERPGVQIKRATRVGAKVPCVVA